MGVSQYVGPERNVLHFLRLKSCGSVKPENSKKHCQKDQRPIVVPHRPKQESTQRVWRNGGLLIASVFFYSGGFVFLHYLNEQLLARSSLRTQKLGRVQSGSFGINHYM